MYYFQLFASKFKRSCKGPCVLCANFAGWMDPCRFVISIMTSDSLWLELLQIHLICYSTVLLPKTKRQQTWLSLPSCWLLSESWHKTWIINAQSRCYEALHNVFTRFQSGPPFYFFMTVVWHWSLAPFILCSRFRHFYYSHPWWGYMIPLASNIGRPQWGARNKLPLCSGQ